MQDRILTDKTLQLGDTAGVVKAFYSLMSRFDIAVAAIGSSKIPGTGGTGDADIDTSTESYVKSSEEDDLELKRFLDWIEFEFEFAHSFVGSDLFSTVQLDINIHLCVLFLCLKHLTQFHCCHCFGL